MFLTRWSARDGSGWLGDSSSRTGGFACCRGFFTAAAVVIGNIGWPALSKNGFVDLHPSSSHPGFDSIDPPGAKVGPGFVYWIARVTPDCVLDASIEITIGTEDPDCAFAGIRTLT